MIVNSVSLKNAIKLTSYIGGRGLRYYAGEAKKPAAAAAAAETPVEGEGEETIKKQKILKKDTRSNQKKILEKFNIPRIIDQADPKYHRVFGPEILGAQKRLEAKKKVQPVYEGQYKDQFKLTSGVIIERFPTIEPELTAQETAYYEALDRYSQLYDRKPINMMSIVEDLPEFKEEKASDKKKGADEEGVQEAEEFEEDFSAFQPEDRITEADRTNDRKSLNRALDKSLYLIIKKTGSRYSWQFPSTNHMQGESIKNTAERALRDSCGESWKYWIPSQAPCGVYTYNVEKELQDLLKVQGIKEFFFRSHYFGGDLSLNPKIVKDYLWVSKSELVEYFDKDYYDQIYPLIYDDSYYSHTASEL